MTDEYAREPGLRDLLNNLRKADEESVAERTMQSIGEIEHKSDVIERFLQANDDCIRKLKIVEDAVACRLAWERHAVGLMVASSEPIKIEEAEVKVIDQDKVARIAQEIEAERHPFLKRIAG